MHVPETEVTIRRGEDVLAQYTVRPGDYVIGRLGADIPVEDALISERHAQLTVDYSALFIEDLGSAAGTFLNEEPVITPTRLWPGQTVRLGSLTLETRRIRGTVDPGDSLAPTAATVRRLLPVAALGDRKYRIGSLIAQGGMGAVLDAQESTTGRTVAMKMMLRSDSEPELHRFIEEAQVTAQLEHPNIVPVHELGVDEHEQVFYTMKYVRGITLKKVIGLVAQGFGPALEKYPLATLLTILQKVCDAVAFAHSRGVIHRDLKPENIMVGDYGEVLVMDWGLAKILNRADAEDEALPAPAPTGLGEILTARRTEAQFATMVGAVVGTPQYMAPEQAIGALDMIDRHTDVYALGAILYTVLALRPPISGTTAEQVLEHVRYGQITPLHRAATIKLRHLPGGRMPESLVAVATKALAFSPEHRYQSVTDFQADIAAYQQGFATGAENAGLLRQMMLLVGRHKREATILAGCVALLLAIGPIFYLNLLRERNAAVSERARAETERGRAEEQRNIAQSERDRTEQALAELRKTAPTHYEQARTLAESQDFESALEKISFARSLAPEEANYVLLHAHLLQGMQRLVEARALYLRVLELRPGDAIAQTNLDLCDALLRTRDGSRPLDSAQQLQLLAALKKQQRHAEAIWLALAIGRAHEVAQERIELRLRAVMQQTAWSTSRERVRQLPDGTFHVDLSKLNVPDLALLRGLPISELNLSACGATDLAPLAELPLRSLDLGELKVTDLSPLAGRPLRRLILHNAAVTNLAPLAGMPLEQLYLAYTPVADLTPLRGLKLKEFDAAGVKQVKDFSALRGMPLEKLILAGTAFVDTTSLRGMPLRTLRLADTEIVSLEGLRGSPVSFLDLAGCSRLKDLAPLTSCTSLETLLIPAQIRDVGFLRKLPNLKRLANLSLESFGYRAEAVTPAAEFFEREGTRLQGIAALEPRLEPLRVQLRQLGLTEDEIQRRVRISPGTGGVLLDLQSLRIAELSALRGLPVEFIELKDTQVADISPLAGAPLVDFRAFNTPLEDLSPLAGNPRLEKLWISGTAVRDLTPLAGLKLKELHLGHTQVRDLSPLKGMPLRQITIDNSPIQDVLPLLSCPTLEDITVSLGTPNLAQLRRLPRLTFISTRWNQRAVQSAGEFWAEFDRDERRRHALAASSTSQLPGRQRQIDESRIRLALKPLANQSKWNELRIRPLDDGTFNVDLSELAVLDLSILEDLPISRLSLRKSGTTDLKPLAGLKLVYLDCTGLPASDWKPVGQLPTLRELNVSDTGFEDLKVLRSLRLTVFRAQTTSIADLTPLQGMPLEILDLKQTRVTDLTPLRNMPLKEIYLWRAPLFDFTPLADCRKLEVVDISDTPANDLEFLRGRKLRELRASRTSISEIEALAGMPLVFVELSGVRVTDFTPLLKCPTIEALELPYGARPEDIRVLRALPKLKQIGSRMEGDRGPRLEASEFWRTLGGE